MNVLKRIDWRWVGIGYCFFVVFHLLPLYLIAGSAGTEDGFWLFAGPALIAFYIGYRSRGVTIAEPAIAAALYDCTLLLEFKNFWGRTPLHAMGIVYVWGVATLVIAVLSAWLGEVVQARKQAKSAIKA